MNGPLNSAQAKLLADFCSDLAKGLVLAGVSLPFTEGKLFWPFKILASGAMLFVASRFLLFGIDLLKGIKE